MKIENNNDEFIVTHPFTGCGKPLKDGIAQQGFVARLESEVLS